MSHAKDKAEAFTKQFVGQMVGDDLLVQEGKEQQREADREPSKTEQKDQDKGEAKEAGQRSPRDRTAGDNK